MIPALARRDAAVQPETGRQMVRQRCYRPLHGL